MNFKIITMRTRFDFSELVYPLLKWDVTWYSSAWLPGISILIIFRRSSSSTIFKNLCFRRSVEWLHSVWLMEIFWHFERMISTCDFWRRRWCWIFGHDKKKNLARNEGWETFASVVVPIESKVYSDNVHSHYGDIEDVVGAVPALSVRSRICPIGTHDRVFTSCWLIAMTLWK